MKRNKQALVDWVICVLVQIKSMELKHLGLNQRIILLGDPFTEL